MSYRNYQKIFRDVTFAFFKQSYLVKDVFIKMKGMIALARLRKNRMWMLILTLLILCFVMPTGLGENDGIEYQINQTRYTNTSDILAKLSISYGNAKCSGWVTPNGTQSCTLTVKLYKKNGTSWNVMNTWTASASGGNIAALSKTVSVSSGTYKVVSIGNVAGEISTATSNIITY